MDYSNVSTFAVPKGQRKRSLSPGMAQGTVSVMEHVPLLSQSKLSGLADNLDKRSKRPRLASEAANLKVSGQLKGSSLHSRLALVDLPCEILQYVFTFVEPLALGRLMRVNWFIHDLLDPTRPLPQRTGSNSMQRMAMRSQDLIWTISRRNFLHRFPGPMKGMTELEMWRLVRGRSCQFCRRDAIPWKPVSMSDPWNAGPGLDNVRPIWPFRVRSCGRCLQEMTIKVSLPAIGFVPQSLIASRKPICLLLPLHL